MEKELQNKLEAELNQQIINLANDIKPGTNVAAKINTGTWIGKNDTVVAYLSYLPHSDPSEESVDATIQIILMGTQGKFSADICWSHGEVIAQIIESDITYNTTDELLDEVKRLGKTTIREIKERYRHIFS